MIWGYVVAILGSSGLSSVATSLVAPWGKDWVAARAERRHRRRELLEQELTRVYEPLMNVLENYWEPAIEEYVGLDDKGMAHVDAIVRENRRLVTEDLAGHIDGVHFDQYINSDHHHLARYDEDRRLVDFVRSRFKRLRKVLGYPQDPKRLNIRSGYRNVQLWYRARKSKWNLRRQRRKLQRGKDALPR